MISSLDYAARRQKIYQDMKPNSILMMFSGEQKMSGNGDEELPYYPNSNFYYLTGIMQSNSILVATKKAGKIKEYLYVSDFDASKVKWTGVLLLIEEAGAISGIKSVFPNKVFGEMYQDFFDGSKSQCLYTDLIPEIKIRKAFSVKDILLQFKDEYPNVKVLDINPILVPIRAVKSSYEIKQIKEAIRITKRGLEAIRNSLEPNLYEYQLKALFQYVVSDTLNVPLAFPSIVASGINAVTLHYPEASSKVKDNELVLFDLGASYNLYKADISRVFPVNGKFSALQRIVYEIVLECNKYIISNVKPGISRETLNEMTKEFLKAKCVEKGLLKESDDIHKVYYHGVSHHLGLDTHDLCLYVRKEDLLEAGNVITVEPGLYFAEHAIGVRIEDDVLVTENGCEVLSVEIPKEIKDIER